MANDALRVLGVAFKPQAARETAETGMVFLGLVGMIDPPRPEARQSNCRVRRSRNPPGDDYRRPSRDGGSRGARIRPVESRRAGGDRRRPGSDDR